MATEVSPPSTTEGAVIIKRYDKGRGSKVWDERRYQQKVNTSLFKKNKKIILPTEGSDGAVIYQCPLKCPEKPFATMKECCVHYCEDHLLQGKKPVPRPTDYKHLCTACPTKWLTPEGLHEHEVLVHGKQRTEKEIAQMAARVEKHRLLALQNAANNPDEAKNPKNSPKAVASNESELSSDIQPPTVALQPSERGVISPVERMVGPALRTPSPPKDPAPPRKELLNGPVVPAQKKMIQPLTEKAMIQLIEQIVQKEADNHLTIQNLFKLKRSPPSSAPPTPERVTRLSPEIVSRLPPQILSRLAPKPQPTSPGKAPVPPSKICPPEKFPPCPPTRSTFQTPFGRFNSPPKTTRPDPQEAPFDPRNSCNHISPSTPPISSLERSQPPVKFQTTSSSFRDWKTGEQFFLQQPLVPTFEPTPRASKPAFPIPQEAQPPVRFPPTRSRDPAVPVFPAEDRYLHAVKKTIPSHTRSEIPEIIPPIRKEPPKKYYPSLVSVEDVLRSEEGEDSFEEIFEGPPGFEIPVEVKQWKPRDSELSFHTWEEDGFEEDFRALEVERARRFVERITPKSFREIKNESVRRLGKLDEEDEFQDRRMTRGEGVRLRSFRDVVQSRNSKEDVNAPSRSQKSFQMDLKEERASQLDVHFSWFKAFEQRKFEDGEQVDSPMVVPFREVYNERRGEELLQQGEKSTHSSEFTRSLNTHDARDFLENMEPFDEPKISGAGLELERAYAAKWQQIENEGETEIDFLEAPTWIAELLEEIPDQYYTGKRNSFFANNPRLNS